MRRKEFAATKRSDAGIVPAMGRLDEGAIRERIKRARTEAGLTQKALAECLDVGERTLQNYEGQGAGANVPWGRLWDIARVTGVTQTWLLHGDADPEIAFRTRLDEMDTKLDNVLKMVKERDPATEVQKSLEDFMSRLGREVGRRPPRSRRDKDHPPEAPEAAA